MNRSPTFARGTIIQRFQEGLGIRWSQLPWSGRLPSTAEMSAYDGKTISSGVPVTELMERAGRAVLECAEGEFERIRLRKGRVVVVCGPGNNGGDGLVLARVLAGRGVEVQIIIAAASRYSPALLDQLSRIRKEAVPLTIFPTLPESLPTEYAFPVSDERGVRALIEGADIVVDALLGTGQRAAPRDGIAHLINLIVTLDAAGRIEEGVLAVDVPSGINGDTGEAYTPHVVARKTVTFEMVKRGMVQYPARTCCGEILVAPIGIDGAAHSEFEVLHPDTVQIPQRAMDCHKGSFRPVVVIGGSAAMPGAAHLAGISALKAGAGLVTLLLPQGVAAPSAYELIRRSVPSAVGHFSGNSVAEIAEIVADSPVVVLGPGLGREAATRDFVAQLVPVLMKIGCPTVIDADALTLLAEIGRAQLPPLTSAVITPHPGEAARLLSSTPQEIQRDRYSAARELSGRTAATIVLKGAATVIYALQRGKVNLFGNPYMATAGSGDVLCGVIAALLAQHLQLREAAELGVMLHALAGDAVQQARPGPLVASDLLHEIPGFVGKFTEQ